MKMARAIGTLASAEKIKEYCNLSKGPVKTSPKEEDILMIDIPQDIIKKSIEEAKVYESTRNIPDASKKEISLKDIVVIDLRPEYARKNVSLESDKQYSYPEIFEQMDNFEKGKTYLFVCDFGVQSDAVAYALEQRGIKTASMLTVDYKKYMESAK